MVQSSDVVMVCGGAGFIGSHFARLLVRERECRVVVFDALTYAGNLANLADLPKERVSFAAGRVQDPVAVEGTIAAHGVTKVVNFAAESHNDRSLLDPGSFIGTDVFGVFTLCEAVRRFGLSRFVHVSTDEVYGSIGEGKFTEDSPLMPNTPYSSSKAGGDLQARASHIAFGTPVMITRGGNNYGPYQYPEKLVPFFATRLIGGKRVPLYGDGSQVREWIHVLDHCEGILTVLEKGVPGEVYNVGDDNERTNAETTRVLLDELGCDESLVKRIEDPRKGAHDRRYAMETGKLRALGWSPTRDWEGEMRATARWYRENEAWWRPIAASDEYQSFVRAFYGKSLGEDL